MQNDYIYMQDDYVYMQDTYVYITTKYLFSHVKLYHEIENLMQWCTLSATIPMRIEYRLQFFHLKVIDDFILIWWIMSTEHNLTSKNVSPLGIWLGYHRK